MVGGVFAKHRFKVVNALQHPYKHPLSEFFFSNPALPGVSNLETTLNWIIAVIYPQTKAAVADVASLPAVGNTINDFRVVNDDGDGNSAAYRWEQREGEAVASWHKIYDMDWGSDSILEQFLTKTQDLYVKANGNDDLDASGAPITGLYAGQTINGGTSANTNLTLRANSGDGVGAGTGYVQVDDNFRPAVDSSKTLGTNTERWLNAFFDSLTSGTLTATGGSITDSSGSISFDNEHLTTLGNFTAAVVKATSSLKAEVGLDTITIVPGLISDTTGALSFGALNLSTTGTLSTGVHTVTNGVDTLTMSPNVAGYSEIKSTLGQISFDNELIKTTGNIQGSGITGEILHIDNIDINGNTISSTDINGNIILNPNGTGSVDVQAPMITEGQTVTGTVGITGQLNADNLRLDGNTLSSTNANGPVYIAPNGSGAVVVQADATPGTDNNKSLGDPSTRWSKLYLGNAIHDGTTEITSTTLQSLRDINTGAAIGDSIFWDGAKWNPSKPDTEIDHGTIAGLADDDHTQYALLAGRAGGQSLVGGTAASNDLTLESTSNGTKGLVKSKDDFVPFTSGDKDLGSASLKWDDLYMTGEALGLRLENLASDPAPSLTSIGRVIYNSTEQLAKIDTGTSIISMGGGGSGSGGINYVSNTTAETGLTTGYSAFADGASYVDGTGGSPGAIFTVGSGTDLIGSKYFNLAGTTGDGVSYDFAIDNAYKASVLEVSFNYLTTAADNDFEVWIYDVTNAVAIQPANYQVKASSLAATHVATFQTASNSTSYRMSIYRKAGTAALKFDNVKVGPRTTVLGAMVTDWQSYTPSLTNAGNATAVGYWRRNGDTLDGNMRVTIGSSLPTGGISFGMPSGFLADTSKFTGVIGIAAASSGGGAEHTGIIFSAGSGLIQAYGDDGSTIWNATNPITFAAGNVIDLTWSVPISGWSSNVVMSDGADSRVVAARYSILTTDQTGVNTNNSAVKVVFNNSTTSPNFDTHGKFSSGTFTVPVSGKYKISPVITLAGTNVLANIYQVRIHKNGSLLTFAGDQTPAAGTRFSVGSPNTLDFVAGDTIDIYLFGVGNNSVSTLTILADVTFCSIERISGPASVGASESVNAVYKSSSGQSIANATEVIVDFATKEFDSHGAVTTGAGWVFTAPVSGKYLVNAEIAYASAAWTIGNLNYIELLVNGSVIAQPNRPAEGTNTQSLTNSLSRTVSLLQGQTIQVKLYHGQGTTLTLAADARNNYISITKVGN
jgi:hypothetical protein